MQKRNKTNIGEKAHTAIPGLIEALKDSSADVCEYAARALGNIGEKAIPGLIEALKDSSADVREYAARALGTTLALSTTVEKE